jgi:predicted NBD/HSP70 family sugar kinase
MAAAIGVVITEHIVAGRLQEENEQMVVVGEHLRFPADPSETEALIGMPTSEMYELLAQLIKRLISETPDRGATGSVTAIGVAVPGVVRNGVVQDAPNLAQIKGLRFGEALSAVLREQGVHAPVHILNDADAVAAGLASRGGHLDRLIRVWTLGNGIGYGRWPIADGVWEGGHTVVTLDPRERFCGCGGVGHIEGIMGNRAMRLRFMDMEPEDVFANGKSGDARCSEFVDLWHRALAAGCATAIHLGGPGRFYFTGLNIRFLDIKLLREHLDAMVRMSLLQSYSLEVLPAEDAISILGAGVAALRAQQEW